MNINSEQQNEVIEWNRIFLPDGIFVSIFGYKALHSTNTVLVQRYTSGRTALGEG